MLDKMAKSQVAVVRNTVIEDEFDMEGIVLMFDGAEFDEIDKSYKLTLPQVTAKVILESLGGRGSLSHLSDPFAPCHTMKSSFPPALLITSWLEEIRDYSDFQEYYCADLSVKEVQLRATAVRLFIEMIDYYVHTSIIFSSSKSDIDKLFHIFSSHNNSSNTPPDVLRSLLRQFVDDHWRDMFSNVLHSPVDIINTYMQRIQDDRATAQKSSKPYSVSKFGLGLLLLSNADVIEAISFFLHTCTYTSRKLSEIITAAALCPHDIKFSPIPLSMSSKGAPIETIEMDKNLHEIFRYSKAKPTTFTRRVVVILPTLLFQGRIDNRKALVYSLYVRSRSKQK
jgi:hypothetical protein